MSLDIKNLSHVERDVGQHIKSTKKHFIWEFLLEGKPHKIELYDSRLSGKKKLIKDGQVWKEVRDDAAFSKSFEIGKHALTIIQHGEKYELRIDNQSFNHIMDLEKNKVFFASGSNPTSTTYTAKPMPQNNQISFGMGNFGVQSKAGNSRPSGLFNFAIKPTTGGYSNTSTQKRFSEIPSTGSFGLESKANPTPQIKSTTTSTNINLLLDLSTEVSTMPPSESKVNNLNVLDSFNSSSNPQSSGNTAVPFDIFNNNLSLGANNSVNGTSNSNFNMDYSSKSFGNQFPTPNNNMNQSNNNKNIDNNLNSLLNGNLNNNYNNIPDININHQYGFNSPGILKYPTFNNINYNNNNSMTNMNNNPQNTSNNNNYIMTPRLHQNNNSGKDPLSDLFG